MWIIGVLLAVSSVLASQPSSSAFEGMPSEKAAEYLDASFSDESLGKDLLGSFKGLSPSKMARILSRIKSDVLRSFLFGEITKQDSKSAIKVLLFAKEQPFDSNPDGSNAFRLLNGVDPSMRMTLKKIIAKADPRYYDAIEKVSQPVTGTATSHLEQVPEASILKRPAMADSLSIPAVAQREYMISTSDKHPKMETTGIGPCVAFTLYDPKTKTGLLAHVDASTRSYDSLDRVLLEFTKRSIDPSRLQARVIGGEDASRYDPHKSSPRTAYDIIRRLNEAGVSIIEKDLLGKGSVRNIIFDLSDGRVYDLENRVHGYDEVKSSRLWDESHKKFCDGYLYRHEASLPSAGVSTDQYEATRQCY